MTSYLQYYNNPNLDNIRAMYKQSGLTQPKVANMMGLNIGTVKSWTRATGSNLPTLQIWNLLICELEARRLEHDNIFNLLKSLN